MEKVGRLAVIARYPVKSMRGEELTEGDVGFQGLRGDRLCAFVQADRASVFPWLTARECPELVQFEPRWELREGRLSLTVRTPSGSELPVESDELRHELEVRSGRPVRLHTDHRGNHDAAYVSVITTSTVKALCDAAGVEPDHRRFRMNFVVESDLPPFAEAKWVGRVVRIGDVVLGVTNEDERCVMVTLDPESGASTPGVLRAASELNGVCAGVYASVLSAGRVTVGADVELGPAVEAFTEL